MSDPRKTDLNQRVLELGLSGLSGLSISAEPPEQLRHRLERERLEIAHRLKEEAAETQHAREQSRLEAKHRKARFWAVFAVVIIVGALGFWVGVFDRGASLEAQTWGRTIGSAVVAGIVGYFGGAASKGSS